MIGNRVKEDRRLTSFLHKDVDDSTGGRLGEYGEGEPSWSPKKVLEQGALTASLLMFFGITVGIAIGTIIMSGKKKNSAG